MSACNRVPNPRRQLRSPCRLRLSHCNDAASTTTPNNKGCGASHAFKACQPCRPIFWTIFDIMLEGNCLSSSHCS